MIIYVIIRDNQINGSTYITLRIIPFNTYKHIENRYVLLHHKKVIFIQKLLKIPLEEKIKLYKYNNFFEIAMLSNIIYYMNNYRGC